MSFVRIVSHVIPPSVVIMHTPASGVIGVVGVTLFSLQLSKQLNFIKVNKRIGDSKSSKILTVLGFIF